MLSVLLASISFLNYCRSQNSFAHYIQTDEEFLLVSTNAEGKEMIAFNADKWDLMMKGTKYISWNLKYSIPVKACIEIANKKEGHCKAGIGFSCSIFDCTVSKKSFQRIVNHKSRTCSVIVTKPDNSTITITFIDKVDWQSLRIIPNNIYPGVD